MVIHDFSTTKDELSVRKVISKEAIIVFLLTLLVLSTITPHIISQLDPPSSDEPRYLMTTISLLKDHDLNECNNYRQHDENSFYPSFYQDGRPYPNDWQGWRSFNPYPLVPQPERIEPPQRRCVEIDDPSWFQQGSANELYTWHGVGLSLLITPIC